MTANTKHLLIRYGRLVGAAAIASLVTFLVSPEVLNIIPNPYDLLVTGLAIPFLAAIDKKIFGESPSPVTTPKVDPPVTPTS